MKKLLSTLAACTLLASTVGISFAAEQQHPPMPQPTSQHQWLQQFVGEWDSTTEAMMEPGKPPVVSQGTESVRPVGGFWTVSEVKSTMMGQPFTGNFTLGYDTDEKEFVGTWVDSMTGQLWEYEGQLDASGKVLTLETEGMCPVQHKMMKMREVIEVKDPNHKVFKSYVLDDNGEWTAMMTSESRRKQ